MRTPPHHPDMPKIPQDGDNPVFNEPWEAQAFAMTLTLYDQGHFEWSEWVEFLSAEIAAAKSSGDPDLGDRYYIHWLAALEKLAASKGLTSVEELLARKEEWRQADHHRDFGAPIELGHKH
ncbi:MAG: nitrile hydratase accessory protein [Kiloniellales bacterium]